MKNYKITFYNDKVYDETMNLLSIGEHIPEKDGILANLLRIFELVEIHGPNLGRPDSAPLSHGIFEFRAKGKEGIARSMFVSLKDKEVVVLHTIIKKSNKIPKKDFDLALKRAKEVQNEKRI